MARLNNTRHELFALALARGDDAYAAYAAVGYKPDRGHASRLAANGSVRDRVAEIMEKAAKEAELTLERVLRELAKVGYSDIRKVVNWQESGPAAAETTAEARLNGAAVTLVDSAKIDAATAGAISEISQTKDGTIRVKMHPKLPALTALLAYLREVEANKPPENKPASNIKAPNPDWPALLRVYGH